MISRRRVSELFRRRVPTTYRVEGALPELRDHSRFAVVAQYSSGPSLSRSFQRLVEELVAADYLVIVSSTTEGPGDLEWPSGRPASVVVLRRPNVGYDFGSWATVLNSFEEVRSAPLVLLLNDSLVGPFAPLTALIADFEDASTSVWGAVRSHQFAPHLQSFFLGFRSGALNSTPLREFWRNISLQRTKLDVIWKYELGLSELLGSSELTTSAAFDGRAIIDGDLNPSILGWHKLLESGFPFVKRQLLTEPEVAPDSDRIPHVIAELFTEDVAEWL